jgi:hypothetical protein
VNRAADSATFAAFPVLTVDDFIRFCVSMHALQILRFDFRITVIGK